MTFLLIQTFLLLLASYFVGAFLSCLVKRLLMGSRSVEPAYVPATTIAVAPPSRFEPPMRPPLTAAPPPVRPRQLLPASPPRSLPPVAPRPIDPVQPRIDVLRRPEPRPTPKLIDPTRFERALMGPDPNEGVPRKSVVELRPAVLKSPTGPARPFNPAPPKKAEPPPEPAPVPPPTPTPPAAQVEAPPPAEVKVTATPAPKPAVVEAPVAPPKRIGLSDATTAAAAAAVAAAKAAAAALVPSSRSEAAEPTKTAEKVSDGGSPAEKPAAKAATPQREPKVAIEGGDDFQRIRAIDAAVEQQLKGQGISYFEHIAAWTAADVKRIGQALGLSGRIDREQWVEQAQILAKGGETYYSRNRLAAQKASAAASAPPEAPATATATAPAAGPVTAPASSPAPAPAVQSAAQATPAAQSENPPSPATPAAAAVTPEAKPKPTQLSGVALATQGRSVAEMASAAAAAIAAASASVTRGLKPIEPISPLSKVNPKISIPAKLSDAIKENEAASASVAADKDTAKPEKVEAKSGKGGPEDLKRIRGIGVLIEKRLNAIGVNRYEQIANWTSGDIDRISQGLEFRGRIERESWVEQARILSSGGHTEFSRRVDRGEVDTSRET